MPRGESRKTSKAKEKALKLYRDGKSLNDIAKALNKPPGTIRRWKNEEKWGDDISNTIPNKAAKQIERSEKAFEKDAKAQLKRAVQETFDNEELNEKQKLFCIEYVQSYNATQSYMNAYNCKIETAMANSYKLLNKTQIQEEIQHLQEVKREIVKQRFANVTYDIVDLQFRIAFASIGNYMSFGSAGEESIFQGNYLEFKDSDSTDLQLIKSVKQGKDGISIQLKDEQKAIEWLTKYFDLFPADRRKAEFDKNKLDLEMLRIEMSQKDDAKDEIEDDEFLDCLNAKAGEVWGGEESE